MTAEEACRLLVEMIRDLTYTRAELKDAHEEATAYRLLAQVAIQHSSELTRAVRRQDGVIARLREENRSLRERSCGGKEAA
jgi:hypothetical protein